MKYKYYIMTMLPFPQNLILWRLERGFTQAGFSQAVGLARPNLADIESGRRDITLKTLHALARILQVKPGMLVDGIPPYAYLKNQSWGRERLERIAQSVVSQDVLEPDEDKVRRHLTSVMQSEMSAHTTGSRSHLRRGSRASAQSWLWLKSHLARSVLDSLITRVREHAKRTN